MKKIMLIVCTVFTLGVFAVGSVPSQSVAKVPPYEEPIYPPL